MTGVILSQLATAEVGRSEAITYCFELPLSSKQSYAVLRITNQSEVWKTSQRGLENITARSGKHHSEVWRTSQRGLENITARSGKHQSEVWKTSKRGLENINVRFQRKMFYIILSHFVRLFYRTTINIGFQVFFESPPPPPPPPHPPPLKNYFIYTSHLLFLSFEQRGEA